MLLTPPTVQCGHLHQLCGQLEGIVLFSFGGLTWLVRLKNIGISVSMELSDFTHQDRIETFGGSNGNSCQYDGLSLVWASMCGTLYCAAHNYDMDPG